MNPFWDRSISTVRVFGALRSQINLQGVFGTVCIWFLERKGSCTGTPSQHPRLEIFPSSSPVGSWMFQVFHSHFCKASGLSNLPNASPDKATLPDFFLFSLFLLFLFFLFFSCADRPHIPHFLSLGYILAIFLWFAACLGVDPHVSHVLFLWIEHEEPWDDWLCQRWLWVQPRFAHG